MLEVGNYCGGVVKRLETVSWPAKLQRPSGETKTETKKELGDEFCSRNKGHRKHLSADLRDGVLLGEQLRSRKDEKKWGKATAPRKAATLWLGRHIPVHKPT